MSKLLLLSTFELKHIIDNKIAIEFFFHRSFFFFKFNIFSSVLYYAPIHMHF